MTPASARLLTLRFVNQRTSSVLSVKICEPGLKTWFDEDLQRELSSWITDYEMEIDGRTEIFRSAGVDWLQSFLLALEGVRVRVPVGEEDVWESAEGLPTWMVLPRCLPIAWGYEIFKEAEQSVEQIVARVHSEIETKHGIGR